MYSLLFVLLLPSCPNDLQSTKAKTEKSKNDLSAIEDNNTSFLTSESDAPVSESKLIDSQKLYL